MTFSREPLVVSCSTFVLLNFSSSLSLSFSLFFARIHDLDANESGQYSVSAPRWHASRTERYKRFFRFALFFAPIFRFCPTTYSFVKYSTNWFTDLFSKSPFLRFKIRSIHFGWKERQRAGRKKKVNGTRSNYDRRSPVSSFLRSRCPSPRSRLNEYISRSMQIGRGAQWERSRYEISRCGFVSWK